MTQQLYRQQTQSLTPTAPVPADRVGAACSVLMDQQLAVYQRLYAVGLTCPGTDTGQPFSVRRSVSHLACVEVFPAGFERYRFLVRTPEDVEAAVTKAELLFAAINAGKPLVHSHACCPVAEIRPCVCNVSFRCAVHGVKCHGNHD